MFLFFSHLLRLLYQKFLNIKIFNLHFLQINILRQNRVFRLIGRIVRMLGSAGYPQRSYLKFVRNLIVFSNSVCIKIKTVINVRTQHTELKALCKINENLFNYFITDKSYSYLFSASMGGLTLTTK